MLSKKEKSKCLNEPVKKTILLEERYVDKPEQFPSIMHITKHMNLLWIIQNWKSRSTDIPRLKLANIDYYIIE